MISSFFEKIGSTITAGALAIASLFGGAPAPESVGGLIAGSTYTLAGSGVSSSATSFTLNSFTLPQNGYPIQDSDLDDTFYLTIEPGNRSRQEIVSCTTVGANSGGNVTISGCTRGLSPVTPYTASSSLQFSHAGGSQVVFADPPQVFNLYAALADNETITGQWTYDGDNPILYDAAYTVGSTTLQVPYAKWVNDFFLETASTATRTLAGAYTFSGNNTFNGTNAFSNTITVPYNTASSSAASVGYVLDVAFAGVPDASETAQGVSELGTKAEVAAGTSSGSEARLVIPASMATSTSQVATTSVIVSNTSGKLDPSWLSGSETYAFNGTVQVPYSTASSSAASVGYVTENAATGGSKLLYSFTADSSQTNSTATSTLTSTTITGGDMGSNGVVRGRAGFRINYWDASDTLNVAVGLGSATSTCSVNGTFGDSEVQYGEIGWEVINTTASSQDVNIWMITEQAVDINEDGATLIDKMYKICQTGTLTQDTSTNKSFFVGVSWGQGSGSTSFTVRNGYSELIAE